MTDNRANTRSEISLGERAGAFFNYLDQFLSGLQPASFDALIKEAGGPERIAIVGVDVINGFCKEGPLASPRVYGIVEPIRRLFETAYAKGVRRFALLRDAHSQEAVEFGAWPPHCLAGTKESEIVDELMALPFSDAFEVIDKNAISAWHGGGAFPNWLYKSHAHGVNTYITVGDCTDLCLHQLALPIRLWANNWDIDLRVVVPENCVDTYDLPVETAEEIGALPHDGNLFHAVFLYHLALNGVEVVKELA